MPLKARRLRDEGKEDFHVAVRSKGESITPPELPSIVPNPADFVSEDCVAVW
jgi:hypothetical protein